MFTNDRLPVLDHKPVTGNTICCKLFNCPIQGYNKQYLRFFGGSYIEIGFQVGTDVLIRIVDFLIQCGALAASVESSGHASNTLLTGQRISPFMSEKAAESLLQYKASRKVIDSSPINKGNLK